MNITVFMKDGTKKEFMHEGRAGGSYTKTIKYVPGFVIITGEWDEQTAIPTEDIKEIKTTPYR